ncbi:MATE family efflux transporter [Pacificoceanicola onchidii]|uniref:MATE family efflux transporter n=1 Tax=Pacificoceanicola onchidii TaxID=2562685 RepID=UPI0010A5538D|nr:MATE family efflux transporter [Pacificoceanicola onchidii]
MTRDVLSSKGHAKAILTLGLPIIGGHLAQFAIGLTDTIMMGWYGVPELAALTLAGSYFFTLFLLGSGFAWAIMPMVAAFSAQGDDVQIRRATRMALWWSLLYFAVSLPLFWFSGPILMAMGQTAETAGMAQTYLRLAGFGMLPALGIMCFKSYLAGLEYTRVVLWVTVAAAVVNALANYAFVFGNWGAPELGITGAAVASVASSLAGMVLIVIYALRTLPDHQIFVRFWKPDWEMFSRVFGLGLPIGLTTLAEVSLFAGSAVLMGWIGVIDLAAHGIALQISTATFMVQMGLSNAATIRAGNAMGRGDREHLVRGAKVTLVMSAIAAVASVALMLLLPELMIGAFIDKADPARAAIIATGTGLLMMAALFQVVDAAQVLHIGFLRGLQDTRVPLFWAVFAYWGVGMPAAYGFGIAFGFGGMGVWLGLTLGLAVAAVALGWRFWTKGVRMVAEG